MEALGADYFNPRYGNSDSYQLDSDNQNQTIELVRIARLETSLKTLQRRPVLQALFNKITATAGLIHSPV